MRTKYLDPDFNRRPRSHVFCCVCQKDLAGEPHRFVLTINGGTEAVHPQDSEMATDGVRLPIGADCVRKIGIEWTTLC